MERIKISLRRRADVGPVWIILELPENQTGSQPFYVLNHDGS
jgi:hypothetical protein